MNAPPTGDVRTKPRVWLGWPDISKERETQTSFQACGYAKGMEEAAASRQQHRRVIGLAIGDRAAYSWVGIKERRLSVTHETGSFCSAGHSPLTWRVKAPCVRA